MTALRVLAIVAGTIVELVTILSAIRATILPRAVDNRLADSVTYLVRAAFRARARKASNFEGRDRVMAMVGPIALLSLLAAWIALSMGAYTLIYLGFATRSVRHALELSGSAVFTLGSVTAPGLAAQLVSYTEAGIGLLLLTLLITYLPSIYGAFSRREIGVSLLRVRAGNPPTATAMLIRLQRIASTQERLGELWRTWETWFADVEETHSTFPVLAFFRSPRPEQSWITAAGALLDAASLWVAAIEHDVDPDAQLCIRAGFLTLRRVGAMFSLDIDDDPAAGGPISVSRDEFDRALTQMADAGVPVIADREAAWLAWRGWRVNYDAALLGLARLIEAPIAPWVSDRSPVPTQTRTAHRRLRRGWANRVTAGTTSD